MPREDAAVFWENWSRYRQELYRICLKMMNGEPYNAEDALSDAMLRAMDKFPLYAPNITNFKGWLIQLTRNVCIDIFRKRQKEGVYMDNLDDIGSENNNNHNGNHLEGTPESMYLNESFYRKIYQAIAGLPPRLREPFILRFFKKVSYRGIAQYFGITNENVRKRIQQAQAILQHQLEIKESVLDLLNVLPVIEKNGESTQAWLKGLRDAEEILHREFREIGFPVAATSIVQVTLPAGMQRSMHIFLKCKPSRQHIKIKTLQKYVKKFPGGWKKRLELAELLAATGNWIGALEEFREVLEKHPQAVEAGMQLGEILIKSGREREAIEIYRNALLYVRKESGKYHLLGMMEYCERRFESAKRAFAKAASLEPGNEAHYQKLGLVCQQAGSPKQAVEYFDKALEINPGDLVSLVCSWESLIAQGLMQKAEAYVNRVLEIYPFDVWALKRKADQRCHRGLVKGEEGKETRELIRMMKKLAPGAAEVDESRAIYYFYRGESNKALEVLKSAALAKQNCPDSWYYYACWLYRAGACQLAADALLKAYELYEKDPRFLQAAGEILTAAERWESLKQVMGKK
jgi:RNA polymerase sigma factor (sigma-70 family)